jgi:hypothetical protein
MSAVDQDQEDLEREARIAEDRAAGRFPRDLHGAYNPERFKPRPLTINPLWHKQHGESVQAYEAFMAYLTQPMESRTLAQACEIVGKGRSCLSKWHRQWSWKLRVASYEEHFLLVRLDSIEADRDRMWREQQNVAESAIDAVTARLKDILGKVGADGKLGNEDLKPEALIRLLDTATKIQRIAVLGRAELASQVKEKGEALQAQWADELSSLFGQFINDLELTPDQQDRAQEVLARLFLDDDQEMAA